MKPDLSWIRLNYATAHHQPSPSTKIRHHPPPSKIYSPPPTTNQNISVTTTNHHPEIGPAPWKHQNIFIYNLLLTNSFFSSKYDIPLLDGDFVWKGFDQFLFQIQNFCYILQYLRLFKVFISRVSG